MNQLLSIELPPACEELVSAHAFQNYIVGPANHEAEDQLNDLTISELFPSGIANETMADCCISGLWLLHNFLDRSHDISQETHSREGSYWHGIMHRLEGDYWNSKYWYRKVGAHSVYDVVAEGWNPEVFVDQCESVNLAFNQTAAGDVSSAHAIAVQEWKALFEFCYQQAN